jgi:hypothetical protein
VSNSTDLKKTRDELKTKRDSLFAKTKKPGETHLALEIKTLDDQVAECIEHLGRETGKKK